MAADFSLNKSGKLNVEFNTLKGSCYFRSVAFVVISLRSLASNPGAKRRKTVCLTYLKSLLSVRLNSLSKGSFNFNFGPCFFL